MKKSGVGFKRLFRRIILENVRDFTSFGNSIILLLISLVILGFGRDFLYILLGLIIIEILCFIIKAFNYKVRPVDTGAVNFFERGVDGSFPSVHTARSSFVFFYLIMTVPDNLSRIIFAALLIAVGLTRVLLKKHFKADVIAGFILGVILSVVIRRVGWV